MSPHGGGDDADRDAHPLREQGSLAPSEDASTIADKPASR